MFHASRVGLGQVVRRMREFAANKHADPQSWKPAKLLARLAADGRGFDDTPPARSKGRKEKARG
jgi:3-hydroxyacyl-CoA dehydrogenase